MRSGSPRSDNHTSTVAGALYPATGTSRDEVLIALDVDTAKQGLLRSKRTDVTAAAFRNDKILRLYRWTDVRQSETWRDFVNVCRWHRFIVHGSADDRDLLQVLSHFGNEHLITDTATDLMEGFGSAKSLPLRSWADVLMIEPNVLNSGIARVLFLRSLFLCVNEATAQRHLGIHFAKLMTRNYSIVAGTQIQNYLGVQVFQDMLTAIGGPLVWTGDRLSYGRPREDIRRSIENETMVVVDMMPARSSNGNKVGFIVSALKVKGADIVDMFYKVIETDDNSAWRVLNAEDVRAVKENEFEEYAMSVFAFGSFVDYRRLMGHNISRSMVPFMRYAIPFVSGESLPCLDSAQIETMISGKNYEDHWSGLLSRYGIDQYAYDERIRKAACAWAVVTIQVQIVEKSYEFGLVDQFAGTAATIDVSDFPRAGTK